MTTKTYLFSYIQQGPLFEEKRKRFGGASGIDVFVLCRNADENTFDKDLVAGVVIDSGFQFRTSLSYLQLIFGGNEDVPIDKLREIRLRIDDLAKSEARLCVGNYQQPSPCGGSYVCGFHRRAVDRAQRCCRVLAKRAGHLR